MNPKLQEIHLKGVPLSCGIAIGPLFFVDVPDEPIPEYAVLPQEVENEIVRYKAAVSEGLLEIRCLQSELLEENNSEGAAILDTHLYLMQDPLLIAEVENGIESMGRNAEYVFHHVTTRYQKQFKAIKDPFFLERLKDIRDVSRRLQGCLRKDLRSYFLDLPPQAVVFIRDLSPSDVVEASSREVAAFVTQREGAASHAVIVSKAKGIPLISNVNFDEMESFQNSLVIVDGTTGALIINPDSVTLERYSKRTEEVAEAFKQHCEAAVKAETYDGYQVELSANISMVDELSMLHKFGGCRVGLFRSEYIFLSDESFPDEERQYQIYRQIVEGMKGLPIVIRVFDLGGDKYMLGQKTPFESNPFLGCRAIRFLLREKHLFKAQLKAILRASCYGNVSIMFPMISNLGELQEAKKLLKEVECELQLGGVQLKAVPIGCMIEVPSAAVIADLLAKECDFLSIGTNDLVQYSLAVDRGNHALVDLYTPKHPSILRLIKHIVSAANAEGVQVSICGEVAADPSFTAILLGLGVHELSVSLYHMAEIKTAIRSCSLIESVKLADKALRSTTVEEVEALLASNTALAVS